MGPGQRPFSTRGDVAASPAGLGADSGDICRVVRCTLAARWERRLKGGWARARRRPIPEDGNHAIRTITLSTLARSTRIFQDRGNRLRSKEKFKAHGARTGVPSGGSESVSTSAAPADPQQPRFPRQYATGIYSSLVRRSHREAYTRFRVGVQMHCIYRAHRKALVPLTMNNRMHYRPCNGALGSKCPHLAVLAGGSRPGTAVKSAE